MMDNYVYYPASEPARMTDEFVTQLLSDHVPFYLDEKHAFYAIDGNLYVIDVQTLRDHETERLVDSLAVDDEAAVRSSDEDLWWDFGDSDFTVEVDMAVKEAGFATEPLRHLVSELYECLYCRMLNGGSWTQREWGAITEAKEVLGLGGCRKA